MASAPTTPDTAPPEPRDERWLTPGVRGIGGASLLADVGQEIPTSLLPSLLTGTLGAPAAALGIIEGVADGLAGAARSAAVCWPTTPAAAARSRSADTGPPPCCQG